jgi:probable rRNA maturation factor
MSATPSVEIVVESPLWEAEPRSEEIAQRAVSAAFAAADLSCLPGAELSVVLADDARLKELNADWRGKDQPTNVLSFPAAEPDEVAQSPLLGDLVIAFETLAREAEGDGKTLPDHLSHLIVHGTLHLFGYDHLSDEEAEEMEETERAALATLGIADPYRETTPA